MNNKLKICRAAGVFLFIILTSGSCKKISDLNNDPNNVTADQAAPDYVMAGVLTSTATNYGNLGSGNLSGAMQQSYQDAWGNTFSQYNWSPSDWSSNYAILRNNKLLLSKAQSFKWNFHQGVALVMRAFNFGVIADFWGDAPDSMALNGDQNSLAAQFPKFDGQQSMYNGVIADLKAAIPFLQGTQTDHPEITAVTQSSDVFYGGDPAKWKRLAFSLLLRYYMRLSAKQDVRASVEAIADSVFASNGDDWAMPFPGTDVNTSYQMASKYQGQSNFDRNKMCGTFTMKLKDLKDPRIVIMAQPVVTPSVVDASKFAPGDNTTLATIIGGVRYINPAAAAAAKFKQFDPATYATDRPYGAVVGALYGLYDTSSVYVGIPIAYSNNDFQYNINGSGTQSTSNNNYVSYLRRDIYDNPKGDLLKERMASYAEICFDLAEAAQRGWNVNHTADEWYYMGIQASFDTWQVFSSYQSDVNNYYGCVKNYNDYIAQPNVAYNGTLQRIIEQKWIAAWQACNEAWMDWRRTGFPTLGIGWASYRGQIPVRFAYHPSELQNNPTNANAAITLLQPSAYVATDGNNSCWSKPWLLQGTTKPW
ncbi:MAG: SusD/RagB family nutrient-binding outer membrane lipoprotein [Sphingobacteriales bacterium]|nr:SusD/RagB family nutrient-binding outer membrane lipoprotein [Sphingobacteriales bacterium]